MKPALFRGLTFLGTSSGCPTVTRNVSSYCLGFSNGDVWMVDAGEGTQHQLQRCKDISRGRIQKIFVTHMHGDHCFGLPGLMASISLAWRPLDDAKSNAGSQSDNEDDTDEHETFEPKPFNARTEFFEVYGPPKLGEFLRTALGLSESHFMFRYRVTEVLAPGGAAVQPATLHPNEAPPRFIAADEHGVYNILRDEETGVTVRACPLQHRVFTIGYVVDEPETPGALDVKKATDLGVPKGPLLAQLKNGNTVTFKDKDGADVSVAPTQVVGASRKGRCAVLLGDTSNSDAILSVAKGADWVVHESTFDEAHQALALPRGHSTAKMAGEFAASLEAKVLLLTHFSARYPSRAKDPAAIGVIEAEAQAVFPGQVIAVDDFQTIDMARKKEKGK